MPLCRLCRCELVGEPVLRYAGMPALSQHLPESPEPGGIELRVTECPACGLVQLDNDPVPYDREVIRAAAYSPEMGEFRKRQFSEWVAKYRMEGGRILEPGCGKIALRPRLAGLDHFRCRFATPRGDIEVVMDKNNPKPEIILPDSIESTNIEE